MSDYFLFADSTKKASSEESLIYNGSVPKFSIPNIANDVVNYD
jgi:hypothetical protein